MQDPMSFSVAAAGVSTKFPLLPEGDVKFQIAESNYGPSNFDKDVLSWKPKFVTVDPLVSVDGNPIPPNTQVFMRSDFDLQEQADPKYPGAWIKSLCLAVDAIFGTTDETRPNVNKAYLDSSVGKIVLGHVIIDEDKKDGTKRNKIKKLKSLV